MDENYLLEHSDRIQKDIILFAKDCFKIIEKLDYLEKIFSNEILHLFHKNTNISFFETLYQNLRNLHKHINDLDTKNIENDFKKIKHLFIKNKLFNIGNKKKLIKELKESNDIEIIYIIKNFFKKNNLMINSDYSKNMNKFITREILQNKTKKFPTFDKSSYQFILSKNTYQETIVINLNFLYRVFITLQLKRFIVFDCIKSSTGGIYFPLEINKHINYNPNQEKSLILYSKSKRKYHLIDEKNLKELLIKTINSNFFWVINDFNYQYPLSKFIKNSNDYEVVNSNFIFHGKGHELRWHFDRVKKMKYNIKNINITIKYNLIQHITPK